MKYFEVFKSGVYPQGKYTNEQIEELAKNYDPSFSEAPLTLDHLQSGPAYGWVEELKAENGLLKAKFREVTDELKQYVNDGKYRKISVEIYRELEGRKPYLKAVSFLGASLPQVKGMDPIKFADVESDIYTFEAKAEEDNKDKIIEDLQGQVDKLQEDVTSFKEKSKSNEKIKDLKTKINDLSAEVASFKAQAENKTEIEKELAEIKSTIKKNEFGTFVEKRIDEGKLLPANQDAVLAIFKELDNIRTFSENSKTIDLFKDFLCSLPKQVEFEEIVKKDKTNNSNSNINEFAYASEESLELYREAEALAKAESIDFKEALIKVSEAK